jgi:hypothetical protein
VESEMRKYAVSKACILSVRLLRIRLKTCPLENGWSEGKKTRAVVRSFSRGSSRNFFKEVTKKECRTEAPFS